MIWGASAGAGRREARLADHRNCNLNLDTSLPRRPDLPRELHANSSEGRAPATFNWTGQLLHLAPDLAGEGGEGQDVAAGH